jgi:hypothetical protein
MTREEIRSLPPLTWERDGWQLEIAVLSTGQMSGDRAIRMWGPAEASIIDDITALRSAAETKVSRYGGLSAAYVISVDAHAPTTDDYDAECALYGTDGMQFWESAAVGSTQPTWVTFPDGLWRDRGGWRRRQVSALVMTAGLRPWNLPRIVPTAWLHPDASFPIGRLPGLFRTAPWSRERAVLSYHPADVSPTDYFALGPGWNWYCGNPPKP